MKSLLFIDDDVNFGNLMRDIFIGRYAVDCCTSADAAVALCHQKKFDLIISDIRMPGMRGPELLMKLQEIQPTVKTALITSYNVDDYLGIARTYKISSIIPKTVPMNFTELDIIVKRLVDGTIFGLENWLLDKHEFAGTFTITTSAQGREIRNHLVDLITQKFGSARDIKLILDETITNAIYHAPQNADGTEKYPELTEITLTPGEQVTVSWGFDSEKYGIAVVDWQGRLTREKVLQKIERQVQGLGLMDENGRGLHISRLLADRMIINIERNVRTEVILMNYISTKFSGYKPLYINEL